MFKSPPQGMNDTSMAFHSCQAAAAMNYNWFPSPIGSALSYQSWNSFSGFWQDGATLEALANWLHRGNATRNINLVNASWRSLADLLAAYGPAPSFDDMAWYAMAFVRIQEVLGDHLHSEDDKFGSTAVDIFKWIEKTGWDNGTNRTTCDGGTRTDSERETERVRKRERGPKIADK